LITEEELYPLLAEQNQFEYQAPVEEIEFSPQAITMIPKDVVEKFNFVPFKIKDNIFYILTSDVVGNEVLEMVYFVSGIKAKKIISTVSFVTKLVQEKILKFAPEDLDKVGLDKIVEDADLEFVEDSGDEDMEGGKIDFNELSKLSSQATIINLVNKIILMAIKDGSSDIHIESFEEKVTVRFRIDGVLYEKMTSGFQILSPVISRIMIMSDMDITERFLPQDGAFKLRFEGSSVEFRVAVMPTIFGLNAVIRILNASNAPVSLEDLGFQKPQYDGLRKAIEKPWGMFLISGPTGSGKSTTLYSVLRRLRSSEVKMITIEDPVENKVEGIQQIQVKINKVEPRRSLTFATGLRTILRLDPDIIMVGEIRDAETAEIAVRAAMTGHLLFSTIHANTAMETIRRLQNIGVDLFTTISALNAIFSQRLIRRLCKYCRVSFKPPEDIYNQLNYNNLLDDVTVFYNKKGCDGCNATGYTGRVGVFEIFEIDDEFRDLVNARERFTVINEWALRHGFEPMIIDGIKKVKSGITSLYEVKRVISTM
ncbi:GspE/PulE family protein, partial [Candidatus Riflebacteria bacterium]